MTIIDSSEPGVAEESILKRDLSHRAVLTRCVVEELERSDNWEWDPRLRSAMSTLRRHVADDLGFKNGWPDDGLDAYEVPPTLAQLLREIELGAAVCRPLSMLWTADTGTEVAGDRLKITQALAAWRMGVATAFVATDPDDAFEQAWARAGDLHADNVLYMIDHHELGIRKVGITVAKRLDTWRRRGWAPVRTIKFDEESELREAERRAITRLDQLGARSTRRMELLYPNLDRDGRTEMYDPVRAHFRLDALIGDSLEESLAGEAVKTPLWIEAPRRAAAAKAWRHPNRDGSAAAKKAVLTRGGQAASTEQGADGSQSGSPAT